MKNTLFLLFLLVGNTSSAFNLFDNLCQRAEARGAKCRKEAFNKRRAVFAPDVFGQKKTLDHNSNYGASQSSDRFSNGQKENYTILSHTDYKTNTFLIQGSQRALEQLLFGVEKRLGQFSSEVFEPNFIPSDYVFPRSDYFASTQVIVDQMTIDLLCEVIDGTEKFYRGFKILFQEI